MINCSRTIYWKDCCRNTTSLSLPPCLPNTVVPWQSFWADPTSFELDNTSNFLSHSFTQLHTIPWDDWTIVSLLNPLCFLKDIFLIWTIFKLFIEYVKILSLFYVSVFWLCGMWDPSSGPDIKPAPPELEGEVLSAGPPGQSPQFPTLEWLASYFPSRSSHSE